MEKKHLFVGYGDIASRCTKTLTESGDQVVGVARRSKPVMPGLTLWQGSVQSEEILQKVSEETFYSATIILSPDEYTEAGYRKSYYDSVVALCEQWKQTGKAPQKIFFISSSSVYGQSNGEWVDEESETSPKSPTAKIILETENYLKAHFSQSVVIRFTGIYGPGRDFLIKQVKAGNGGSDNYTNRIHVEDCARTIIHLIGLAPENLQDTYLASDLTSVKANEIRAWLAKELKVDVSTLEFSGKPVRAGNKRCSSERLIASGFEFKYPSYKDGYSQVLNVMENRLA